MKKTFIEMKLFQVKPDRLEQFEAKIEEMAIEYSDVFTKKYNAEKCAQLGINTADLEAKGYVAIEKK